MAEKHKSKYKKPENKKPTYRKDIKDYTLDDKDGKSNPKSAGKKLPIILRKTDKEVIDNGNLVPKYEADDRLYKDLEDADYDSKTALKRLTKRQNDEAKDVKDVIKDKIENLTREQKERLVREYVRRKIEKVLYEHQLKNLQKKHQRHRKPRQLLAPRHPLPQRHLHQRHLHQKLQLKSQFQLKHLHQKHQLKNLQQIKSKKS